MTEQMYPDSEALDGSLDEVMMRCLRGELYPNQVVWKWARERLEQLEGANENNWSALKHANEKIEGLELDAKKLNNEILRLGKTIDELRRERKTWLESSLEHLRLRNLLFQRQAAVLRDRLVEAAAKGWGDPPAEVTVSRIINHLILADHDGHVGGWAKEFRRLAGEWGVGTKGQLDFWLTVLRHWVSNADEENLKAALENDGDEAS